MKDKKLLVLCQMYWPDETSGAQMVTDLTLYLDHSGVDVTVYCSNHAYEKTSQKYASNETLNGIKINRIRHTSFGKASLVGRVIDIITFNVFLFVRLIFINRKNFDTILSTTNPPLMSFLGIWIAKWKKIKFYYWAFDLQPEIAFATGYLKNDSFSSRLFERMSSYVRKNVDHIIALDRFMYEILSKKVKSNKITIAPVWSANQKEGIIKREDNDFLDRYDLIDKTVIMYSGNITIAHPLETILLAVKALKDNPKYHFVFIGEGLGKKQVIEFKVKHNLSNVSILPYQPRHYIHISLSAADLQVVVLGDNLVGLAHPCKIYTVMDLAKPVLYIGPKESHVTDLLAQVCGNILVEHNKSNELVLALINFQSLSQEDKELIGNRNKELIERNYEAIKSHKKIMEILNY